MTEQPILEYHEDDGIHIFTFHDNSRQAMNEYIEQLRQIIDPDIHGEDGQPLYLVMDISRKGMFSLAYMKSQLQNRDESLKTPFYIAYIGNSGSDEFLMQLMGSMLPQLKNQRRVFKPEQMDEAIAWLRAASAPSLSDE